MIESTPRHEAPDAVIRIPSPLSADTPAEVHTDPAEDRQRVYIAGLPGADIESVYNAVTDRNTANGAGRLFATYALPANRQQHEKVTDDLNNADLIVLVVNAAAGTDRLNVFWAGRLSRMGAQVVVMLHHADNLPDRTVRRRIRPLQKRVQQPIMVVTDDAQPRTRQRLFARIVRLCPELTQALVAQRPSAREDVARHTVQRAVHSAYRRQIDPIEDADLLLRLQTRMIQHIATIYGYDVRQWQDRPGLMLFSRWTVRRVMRRLERLPMLAPYLPAGTTAALLVLLTGWLVMHVYRGTLPGWLIGFRKSAWRQADALPISVAQPTTR